MKKRIAEEKMRRREEEMKRRREEEKKVVLWRNVCSLSTYYPYSKLRFK